MRNCMKSRLCETRRAVKRLSDIQLYIMYQGEDWKPEQAHVSHGVSDPTARKAIYTVDTLSGMLESMQAEAQELTEYIGATLELISAIRDGLGDKYADACDWLYIDGLTPREIRTQYDVKKPTLYARVGVACDWVDSIGISKILIGDYAL